MKFFLLSRLRLLSVNLCQRTLTHNINILSQRNSKNKKKLKELENKLGAPQAPVYTPYTGAYNAPTEENSDK